MSKKPVIPYVSRMDKMDALVERAVVALEVLADSNVKMTKILKGILASPELSSSIPLKIRKQLFEIL